MPTPVLALSQKAPGGNTCSCWEKTWIFAASPGGSHLKPFLASLAAAASPQTPRVSSVRRTAMGLLAA